MATTPFPFAGTIPGIYEQYLGPYIFEPYAVYITSRIKKAPQNVLEIAAGTGRVSRHIAERIGSNATLTAIDISPAMLHIAKQQVHAPNVEFLEADAQALPFPDNSFDTVICQFGFMFLPDRQKGFDEAYRVLKPGGQFLFLTWDRAENNITYHICHQTVLQYLKAPPPPFYGKPYTMYDPDALRSHVMNAGFTNATIEKITLQGETPTAMHAATGFIEANAIADEIVKEGPGLLQTIKDAVVAKIHAQVSKDPVRSELNAWLGEAFK